jgi:hypothetical protein
MLNMLNKYYLVSKFGFPVVAGRLTSNCDNTYAQINVERCGQATNSKEVRCYEWGYRNEEGLTSLGD